jgi:predicted aconitase
LAQIGSKAYNFPTFVGAGIDGAAGWTAAGEDGAIRSRIFSMHLTPDQTDMLDGGQGWPLQIAMKMLTAVGAALDAPDLIPVKSAHLVIDGTALGVAGRNFLERLVDEGGRFVIPASINAIAVDRTKPDMSADETDQIRMLEACEKMGALPSCSCNPFIQGLLPAFGEHVAWSESATAPFVNSVLGARTNREGATAVASALTGLAPRCGMHLDDNRRGEILLRVEADIAGVDRFSLLGALAGRLTGDRVPVLDGIGQTPSTDDYVAFGAAFAIHGAAAMFHIAGITPEAPDLETAFGGGVPVATIVDDAALDAEHARTATGTAGPVDIVSIGCPHASLDQLRSAAAMVADQQAADRAGGHASPAVKFYIHTNRSTYDTASSEGVIGVLTGAGVSVTADNCAVVSYDRVPAGARLATNSAKMALFARSVSNAKILFGSTAQCIAAGLSGRWER